MKYEKKHKQKYKRIGWVVLLSIALLVPSQAGVMQASAKVIRKNGTVVKMRVGKTAKIRFSACKKKPVWKITNKKVAKIIKHGKTVVIKAKSAGTTKLVAKVKGKKYYCRIKVLKKKPQTTIAPTTSETPTVTQMPQETKVPEATESPETTEVPESTQTPAVPETSKAPESTQCPEATKAPETTKAPESSETLETTQTPQVTEAPQTTQVPQEDYDAATVDANDYASYFSLYAIHHSTATYYDNGYTNTCCNLDDIASGYDVAAINEYDYHNGLMAGAYLQVTGPNGSVDVLVTDLMPYAGNEANCTVGALDLNENTFAKIANKVDGKVNISWKVIAFPTTEPIQYKFKSDSSQWWAQVQVRNHRYPVQKLEVKKDDGSYMTLPRENYNYFTAASGFSSAVTFRVTDIFGHVLEDTVSFIPGTVQSGSDNF